MLNPKGKVKLNYIVGSPSPIMNDSKINKIEKLEFETKINKINESKVSFTPIDSKSNLTTPIRTEKRIL